MVIDGDLAARTRADDVSSLLALFVDLADGNGQFEQNFTFADALTTADRVVTARYHFAARQRDEFLNWHAAVSPAEVDRYLTAF